MNEDTKDKVICCILFFLLAFVYLGGIGLGYYLEGKS